MLGPEHKPVGARLDHSVEQPDEVPSLPKVRAVHGNAEPAVIVCGYAAADRRGGVEHRIQLGRLSGLHPRGRGDDEGRGTGVTA